MSSATLLVAAALSFQTQGSQEAASFVPSIAPASEEAAQAIQKFAPAPGIEVALFAAEPRVANPVAFALDHGGDVYVAEAFRILSGVTDIRRHMDWLDDDLAARTVADRVAYTKKFAGDEFEAGYCTASERVRLIRDTDGDGVADQDSVFADGFDDPAAGIGAGVLSYQGDVYYTCIPDLWLLRDPDEDGVAEERRALSSGYGVHIALYGHDLHGLRIGPDRRLYFSIGDRGFRVETTESAPSGAEPVRRTIDHTQCGAVLRCELDGTNLEVWHTGLRNPQELVFDAYGDLWTGDNNSDGGDRARWVHVVEGGDSGWRYPYQWITEPVQRGPWNDERLWVPHFAGQAAYIVPPVANLADGPAGLTYYPGTGLDPSYDGHFFLCDFRGDAAASGIHTFTVEPRGASFVLGAVRPFLWGALVTDCDFGPDGALWFSDWVYGWEQTGKGRLYRALDPRAQDSALVAETRRLLAEGVEPRSNEELVELLAHVDQRVRQEAHFELAQRERWTELGDVAQGAAPLFARLHAIWGLGIAGRKHPAAFDRLLRLTSDPDAEVRAQAIRVLGDERAANAEQRVVELLADASPRVRFFAALAAGRLQAPRAAPALAEILRATGESDPDLRHAAVMGLVGCAGAAEIDQLAADPSPDVRLGALLVLRQRRDATIARFLLDAEPRVVLEAARAIHDLPIERALESLARTSVERCPQENERALVRRVLNANYRLGRSSALADYALREELDEELRVEALDMLAHWKEPPPRDRVTNEWRPLPARGSEELAALATRMSAGPLDAAPDAVVEAYARFAAAAQARAAGPFLARLVTDKERGSSAKTAALEALEMLGTDELVPTVRAALGDTDGRVRASALERLERIAPAEVLEGLGAVVEQGEIAERRAAYRILARHGEPTASEIVARELERLLAGLVPAELALDLVTSAEARAEPPVQALLARQRDARSTDALLQPHLDGLFGGDASRGSAVFERVDLSCTRCHAWWADAAERVGPNLFGLGQRLTRLQILESILAPNRRTTPGYGATVFFLHDGRIVSGRVVEESDTLVRLFDAKNEPIAFDPAEVEERRADLSAMPEDLAQSITREEMRDLLEYLARL